MKKELKILYFEGAGCEGTGVNDVNNCRIRTAFTNNEGKKIYLELGAWRKPTYNKRYGNKKEFTARFPHDNCISIDFCHYITSNPEIDDCNQSNIKYEKNGSTLNYTKKNILEWVNKNCNCSFDDIEIINSMGGYRVFAKEYNKVDSQKNYNYGDTFKYDKALENKRIIVAKKMHEEFKTAFKEEFDNTSIWCDYENNNILHVKINVSDEKLKNAGYKQRYFDVEI